MSVNISVAGPESESAFRSSFLIKNKIGKKLGQKEKEIFHNRPPHRPPPGNI
jgi:hypothetical protein